MFATLGVGSWPAQVCTGTLWTPAAMPTRTETSEVCCSDEIWPVANSASEAIESRDVGLSELTCPPRSNSFLLTTRGTFHSGSGLRTTPPPQLGPAPRAASTAGNLLSSANFKVFRLHPYILILSPLFRPPPRARARTSRLQCLGHGDGAPLTLVSPCLRYVDEG